MEDNAFEKYDGVKVRSHQPERIINADSRHRIYSTCCRLAIIVLALWTAYRIVTFLFSSEPGSPFPRVYVLVGSIGILMLCMTHMRVSIHRVPEHYELEISESCSATSLLQIQENWDLTHGDEPGVWVATPK